MVKRRKRGRGASSQAKRLPFPPPFALERLNPMKMSEFIEDDLCRGYLSACEEAMRKSGRPARYVDLLAMFAHSGRLAEFGPHSMGKFLAEAGNQNFSDSQLIQAIDGILETLTDNNAWPYLAEKFEFTAFLGDFLLSYAKHHEVNPLLVERAEMLRAMSLGYFILAVKHEYRLQAEGN